MKRLVKKAIMDIEMFQGTIDQLGDKGRDILKAIEDYKFSLEQAARIVSNDQELAQRIIQEKKKIDQAGGQIYSIVFDIENIDITQAYEAQQNIIENPSLEDQIYNDEMPTNTEEPQETDVDDDIPNEGEELEEDFELEDDVEFEDDNIEITDDELDEMVDDVVDNIEE